MNYRKTLKYLSRLLSPRDRQGVLSNPLKYLKHNLKAAPKKLYKFRACTEINLSNLQSEDIYFAQASSFSDDLDVSVLFDSITGIPNKKIINLYKKECLCNYIDNFYSKYDHIDDFNILPQEVRRILQKAYDGNFNFIPQKVKGLLLKQSRNLAKRDVALLGCKSKIGKMKSYKQSLKFIIDARVSMAQKLDDIFSQYGCSEALVKRCKDFYTVKLAGIKKETRDATFVHSFCADYSNLSMWEKYADYHKGFCIEYTLDADRAIDVFMHNRNEIKLIEILFNLFKVRYRDPHVAQPVLSSYKYLSALYDSSLIGYEPRRHLGKILSRYAYQKLMKRRDFEFENEWRSVLFNVENQLLHFPLTSGIYIGRDASKDNYNRLVEIAKKLKVPAYVQTINKNDNTYHYVLIEE